MVVRGSSLSHLTLARQHFVKNSTTAFHENPINPIVTNKVSQKRGRGGGRKCLHIRNSFSLRKQYLKMQLGSTLHRSSRLSVSQTVASYRHRLLKFRPVNF
jgi:hypothetical protein